MEPNLRSSKDSLVGMPKGFAEDREIGPHSHSARTLLHVNTLAPKISDDAFSEGLLGQSATSASTCFRSAPDLSPARGLA